MYYNNKWGTINWFGDICDQLALTSNEDKSTCITDRIFYENDWYTYCVRVPIPNFIEVGILIKNIGIFY